MQQGKNRKPLQRACGLFLAAHPAGERKRKNPAGRQENEEDGKLQGGLILLLLILTATADKTEITMEELKEYPCLSFDQGSNNSFFLAEEVLSTYEYKRIIKANDRATMLNLMVGLNGYTLCSGIICEELNGSDYRAVPLHADENMMIGYVSRKGMSISAMGLQYLEEIRKYKEFVL